MKKNDQRKRSRREFFKLTACGVSVAALGDLAAADQKLSLAGYIGITTGGGFGQRKGLGKLTLLDLPNYLRDDLGISLIDINSRWFDRLDEKLLNQTREAAENADCFFTNFKVNHGVGNLNSPKEDIRKQAMLDARKRIDAAKILGTRWIRFVMPKDIIKNPAALRELADYAGERGIQLLVENAGWIKSDPSGVAASVKAIGRNVAPCPDTGNWDNNQIREKGLPLSFPGAASCDFKVFQMGPDKKHPQYDLKHCFDIGWKAGFRGPWVIEHMHDGSDSLAADTVYIRDMLMKWIEESA